jgi:SpoVK/Ycf46/Vps4 family AAA+-type ATPase
VKVEDNARGAADAADQDLRALEQSLQRFSRRIDGVLRGHFATHGLHRLLRRIRDPREYGRRVVLSAPAMWLVAAAVLLVALVVAPMLAPRFAHRLPHIAPWLAATWLVLLVVIEQWVQPRLLLLRYRFRLMRLERRDGAGVFSDVYIVSRLDDTPTGFGMQEWKPLSGMEPGDLVVSVSDAHDRGVALIPLRTEGRLPAVVWERDLSQPNVFAPLTARLRTLAHQFDQACEQSVRHAGRLDRNRTLRSGKVLPEAPVDAQQVWAGVALAPPVKQRLIALAGHFAAGSASATRGLLLYGPPGTGKTTIARAFADSMRCAFFPLSLTDLKSGYIGQSGENVKALWQKARGEARAVIFVDECEGVFGRRGGVGTDSFVEEIVTAFLAQWDGFQKQSNVWVVGATNRRDLIDPALLSRFEDQIEIGLPDDAMRLQLLAAAFARLGIPPPLPPRTTALTAGMSGRDLDALAKRVVREHGTRQPLTDETLEAMTTAMRRQGSTATDAGARWDTLVLSEPVLRELKTTAGLLQHAETFRKRGIGVPRGLLLYGPPGTGKTQIARTLANETGLRFIAASTADIKQGFLGQSGQKVRELFERARESAPSLLFIDEIDIVAAARGGQSDAMLTEIVGQLLQEMDGVFAQPQPVFVLAATNRIDQIDAAVLSRLPKQIEIPLPDHDGVRRLLEVMLRGKPLAFAAEDGARTLAARAGGRSGRDLRSWVESAEHRAVARAIEAGDPEAVSIALADFDA